MEKDMANPISFKEQIDTLNAEVAELKALIGARDDEIIKLKELLPDTNFIVLKSNNEICTVIVDGKRYMFNGYIFRTKDRLLANKMLAAYRDIMEIPNEQVPGVN